MLLLLTAGVYDKRNLAGRGGRWRRGRSKAEAFPRSGSFRASTQTELVLFLYLYRDGLFDLLARLISSVLTQSSGSPLWPQTRLSDCILESNILHHFQARLSR